MTASEFHISLAETDYIALYKSSCLIVLAKFSCLAVKNWMSESHDYFTCQVMSSQPQLILVLKKKKMQPKKSYNKTIDPFFLVNIRICQPSKVMST